MSSKLLKTSLWPLQMALFDRLSNDAALMAKITGVHDTTAPTNAEMPYITLGDDTVNDYSSKTFFGEEITHTLHCWSDYEGKKEAKEILDLMLQALSKEPLTLTPGFTLEGLTRDYMEVLEQGDYSHGVLRLRIKIKQN